MTHRSVPARGATAALVVVLAAGLTLAGVTVALPAADGGGPSALQAGNETPQADNGTTYVRVVHASPDAPNVDVLVDNETALENVSFGTISDYLELPAGEHRVTLTVAGNASAVVFDANASFEAGVGQTLIALGEVTQGALIPFDVGRLFDDATTPGENESLVRLAHLAPDAPAVDVTVAETGDLLFENVTYGSAAPYESVPPGDYTLEVRGATPAGNGSVVATFNVTLEGGTAVTGIAVGYLDPAAAAGNESFDLLLATDRTLEPVNVTPTANVTETPAANATETPAANETEAPAANETAAPAANETEASAANETVANETAMNETAPANETMGNETAAANETAGNETAAVGSDGGDGGY